MKSVKQLAVAFAASALTVVAAPAFASLYTQSLGSVLSEPSNCDDCFAGEVAFGGNQTMNFFGATYSGLYVGSNGYVTFGSGATNFSPASLSTQTIRKMIAGLFTDLDSRNDAASNVYVNNDTAGQLIVTWQGMGHYTMNYGVRSTFQLVVRSDQFAIPTGEGQIGFYYDSITDTNSASAGFGDGVAAVNPGEVAFASLVAANSLSNHAPLFFDLNNGAPVVFTGAAGGLTPSAVPEPESIALLGLGAIALVARRRRKSTRA